MDPQTGLKKKEQALVLIMLAAWLALFSAGVMIDSSPYREAILAPQVGAPVAEEGSPPADPRAAALPGGNATLRWIANAVRAALTYTLTNLLFLALFAGVAGALGRKSQLFSSEGTQLPRDTCNPVSSALLRSFLVYVAFIAGVLLIDQEPFTSPTMEQYIRLAGIVSLFSFLVNWNLDIFEKTTSAIAARAMQLRASGARVSDEVAKIGHMTDTDLDQAEQGLETKVSELQELIRRDLESAIQTRRASLS